MTYTACQHDRWEPVHVAGETVANVCTVCYERLPATYNGEVQAIMAAGEADPVAYIPLPNP
jgi:hypothetical protein